MESFLKNIKGIWDIFLPAVLENPISLGGIWILFFASIVAIATKKKKEKKENRMGLQMYSYIVLFTNLVAMHIF